AGDLRAQASSLAGVAQYDAGPGTARLDPDAAALSITALSAGRELAGLLDLRATTGRSFAASDFANGAAPVALLTDRFWRRRFGGDAGVIGRSIDIGSDRTQIVGVLPPAANHFPAGGSDVWIPLTFSADSFLNQRGSIALSAIGRLCTGQSRDTAQAEVNTIADRLAKTYPDTNRSRRFAVDELQGAMAGPVRPLVMLIAGAIRLLLAVACANIANLLLAHAQARAPELALRGAIGASRGRLLRQLWTETLALFAVAGTAGVVCSLPLARALVAPYPEALPLAADVQLDLRVLAIAALVTLVAALTAELPLARRASGWSASAALGAAARAPGGAGLRRRRARRRHPRRRDEGIGACRGCSLPRRWRCRWCCSSAASSSPARSSTSRPSLRASIRTTSGRCAPRSPRRLSPTSAGCLRCRTPCATPAPRCRAWSRRRTPCSFPSRRARGATGSGVSARPIASGRTVPSGTSSWSARSTSPSCACRC